MKYLLLSVVCLAQVMEQAAFGQDFNEQSSGLSPKFRVESESSEFLSNSRDDSSKISEKSGKKTEAFKIKSHSKEAAFSFPAGNKSIKKRLEHADFRSKISAADWVQDYNQMKQALSDKTGISYSLDISALGQRGAPNGKITPWQFQYYGTLNWNVFQSKTFGAGSVQAAYTAVRYARGPKNGNALSSNIGVISSVNDYGDNENNFNQLSYTQQFGGKMNILSVTLGQFPISNFDGGAYDNNQQVNFLNLALSQNGSSTYPTASLGGYVSLTPNDKWNFTAGLQDATNISGSRITTKHFGDKKFTSFISVSYTPTWQGVGSSDISVLFYNQPGVEEQPSTSNGWSVNISQNIGEKWAVFARVNGAVHSSETIKQSYVFGGVYNNPLGRNPLDQIGLAVAVNKLNKKINGAGTRSVENVFEAYWAWGVSSVLTITPDIQFYVNPGENKKSDTATVASIRATLMF
jgi:hypothetical protein